MSFFQQILIECLIVCMPCPMMHCIKIQKVSSPTEFVYILY